MQKLISIQNELKAPKGQFNSFGKYKYRNCEDILEALKPLLLKYGCLLTITDNIQLIGDRYYVMATATLKDETNTISVSASAREEESKKGMDGSQVTGASSSYARKGALNGLFLIDDTKDADNHDNSDTKDWGKLEQLFASKSKSIDNKFIAGIERVIENKEITSYDKTYNYLNKL